jgi:hypothetical protein
METLPESDALDYFLQKVRSSLLFTKCQRNYNPEKFYGIIPWPALQGSIFEHVTAYNF